MHDLSVTEAQGCILRHATRTGTESVALHDSLGRVLARNVTANRNHPPYDVSAMDGYAVRFSDIAESSARLAVVDDIRAGCMPSAEVMQGQAARIMTGAPVPPGVDTVVRVEDTESNGDHVSVLVAPKRGANIRPMGENLKNGEVVLQGSTTITPGVLAILAMIKQKQVPVFARPSVAILSTGDELEDIDDPIDERKIPNANSHALYAQCKSLGIEAALLGIARDDPAELKARLTEGLKYDVLLASGGVSVGHHDFVRPMMQELGVSMHFWRVSMRPGHPLAFGTTARGSMVFGLPGNPVASMVCFEQFAAPALRCMMGHRKLFRRTVRARMAHDLDARATRTLFIRVTLADGQDGLVATSTGEQGSGVLMSMAMADGFLVVPAGASPLQAGETVTLQLLQGMEFQAQSGIEGF